MDFEKVIASTLDILEHRNKIITKDYDISKNVNREICAECGGACCKMCGCHFSPDDFEELSFEFLRKEIEKGYISIDFVDRDYIYCDHGYYILRMRNKGAPIVDTKRFRGSPCIKLTEGGCEFDYEQRPTGGKLLIPSKKRSPLTGRNCESKYSLRDCCFEWEPYQEILRRLAQCF